MTPIFSLRDVQKRRGAKLALNIESLDLLPGKVYTLLGSNGAGKSTLLQLLALLERPTAGEIAYDGTPVRWSWRHLRRMRREVTLVHQAPYLFDCTVGRNIEFGLRFRRLGATERRRRVLTALQTVGLGGVEKRPARELSGGEMQRVALARALALKPRVLLLDEPTGSVDRDSADLFEKVVAGLPGKGVSVILSTHDTSQPGRIGSDVIRLADGRPVDTRSPVPDESIYPEEASLCLSPLKMQEI